MFGGNLTGNNAYFVRRDLLNDRVQEVTMDKAYRESKFRESRGKELALPFLGGSARLDLLKGMEVINVIAGERENL